MQTPVRRARMPVRPMRLRLVAPVLLAALVVAWFAVPDGPGALAAVSPIQPGNTPTPIPGATNGQLPASDLVEVTPSCFAARAAGPSLRLLLLTARGDHQSIGTEVCYRPEQTQAVDFQSACSSGNCACAGPPGHSMHGWGKAVDFSDRGGGMDFGSPGYAWLKANAGRFGWNHPGWAEPGGSPCPEAWHWEWVGDGGTYGDTPIRADVVSLLATPGGAGYSTVTGLGLVTAHGDAIDAGSASSYPLAQLVVGGARTPTGRGYWLVAADGGVFTFGDAGFFGSLGAVRLNQPIVGMAATPTGRGYWLVAADGGVFTFGDARFSGSAAATPLAEPVVGMTARPGGGGYWLLAADGTVVPFGAAGWFGNG